MADRLRIMVYCLFVVACGVLLTGGTVLWSIYAVGLANAQSRVRDLAHDYAMVARVFSGAERPASAVPDENRAAAARFIERMASQDLGAVGSKYPVRVIVAGRQGGTPGFLVDRMLGSGADHRPAGVAKWNALAAARPDALLRSARSGDAKIGIWTDPTGHAFLIALQGVPEFGWTVAAMSDQAYPYRQFDDTLLDEALIALGAILISTILLLSRHGPLLSRLTATERRLDAILNNAADGVMAFDGTGRVESMNRAAEGIFGYAAKELVGRNASLLVPEPRIPQLDEILKSCRQSAPGALVGSGLREMTGRRKDGTTFPMELAIGDVKVGGKRLFIGTVRDVSELHQSRAELRDSEARYRGLVDLSPDAILIYQAGRIIFANPALLRMVGATDESGLIGRSMLDIVHPDDRDLVRDRDRAVLAGGATQSVPLRVVRADGDVVFAESVATRFDAGEDRSVMVLLRDITSRKQGEEERAVLEERLNHSQRMEALGTLAGGIAHDFNNVLVPMIGLTELTMDSLPEGGLDRSNLDKVVQAGVRARDLVEQILTFSRHESTERRVVDLGEVVDEAMKLLGSTTPRTIALRHSIEPGLPPIFADPGNLHQVIVNLANNAVYAIGEGHGTVAITLKRVVLDNASDAVAKGLPPGPYAELSVRDSGCGISPEAMARIFEPFFTTKPVGEGTGLGLSIIHGIVASHGGLISVDSELGKGTTVTIHLPFWNGEQTTGESSMDLLAATG